MGSDPCELFSTHLHFLLSIQLMVHNCLKAMEASTIPDCGGHFSYLLQKYCYWNKHEVYVWDSIVQIGVNYARQLLKDVLSHFSFQPLSLRSWSQVVSTAFPVPRKLAPEVVASFPEGLVLSSSELYTWSRENSSSSRLSALVPRFRICIVSFTFLVKELESLSMILSPSQSIRWFSWATWSVIADLCCSEVEVFLVFQVNFFSAIFFCVFLMLFQSHS